MQIFELQPQAVWQRFYEITQIPHPSGHTRAIADYVVNIGKELGLETLQDEAGNVLIRKPAPLNPPSGGAGIILQAHLDMVPQKNSCITHHFETDPVQPYIDGNLVKARNTTLGADNGIGMAMALAVLQSDDIRHGNIEVLLTNDEETGMHGAFGLQPGWLKGNVLINLDSEDEGELFIGCAGGIDASVTLPYETDSPATLTDRSAFQLTLSGLRGGHSGCDIHLERANANKLLFRALKKAAETCDIRLVSVEGGNLRNVIPREAGAVVLVQNDRAGEFEALIAEMETLFRSEYEGVEENISLVVCRETARHISAALTAESQQKLIDLVMAFPNGVYRHIARIPDVVETSNNLAIVKTAGNKAVLHCLLRSSVESRKAELCSVIESLAKLAGAKIEFSGGYPGWQPDFNSPILKTMTEVYKDLFGEVPQVKIIHAGLECGIIGANYPHLDMISIGPTIRFAHSPDEELHIGSVERCWKFLVKTLEMKAASDE
ncbi:MAG: aminoacyl-histidine dipeptidase [Prevotellaceae bacterium]|jgi:dipeptidase D|nr:aminoacyl-histidine dipeptidase [Prevotellaceae bacterium]